MSEHTSDDAGARFETPRTAALEAELALTRAQLASTVDELAERLDPRTQVGRAVDGSKKLVADAVSADAVPEDRTRARMVLGGVVGVVALLVALGIKRR